MSTSFVLTLCFEMPFANLEKIVMGLIFGQGNKKKEVKVEDLGIFFLYGMAGVPDYKENRNIEPALD